MIGSDTWGLEPYDFAKTASPEPFAYCHMNLVARRGISNFENLDLDTLSAGEGLRVPVHLVAAEARGRHGFPRQPCRSLVKATRLCARLNAIFSSDIGHFDVPDMTAVVPEAYELVEHELITDDDFRDFMFANAVRFWGEVNPDFFKDTVVEKQSAGLLARPGARA